MVLFLLVHTLRVGAYLYMVAYIGYLFTVNKIWLP
jgi:hypothetical protein